MSSRTIVTVMESVSEYFSLIVARMHSCIAFASFPYHKSLFRPPPRDQRDRGRERERDRERDGPRLGQDGALGRDKRFGSLFRSRDVFIHVCMHSRWAISCHVREANAAR